MDPRSLTIAEIAVYLRRARRVPAAVLRALDRDHRVAARRLAAGYEAALAAERRERLRLRALYRGERRRAPAGQMAAGVDEAGRGPLAGPVVAAAVILGSGTAITGLDDSKRLSPAERETLEREIHLRAYAIGVGEASTEEIDRYNILGATRLAMRRAVDRLVPAPQFLLIDGREGLPGPPPQATVIGGDASCACIAAASIVAKVTRDRLMRGLDERFPVYGFARHKGYATPEHLAALARYGPCAEHRRAFLPEEQLALFETL